MLDQPDRPDPSFEELQEEMCRALGNRGVSDLEHGTVVVLPSISFPPEELQKIVGIQFYEERMLCMLLLLRRPRLEMIYLTSVPIDPVIVDYYLGFLPDPEAARSRLHLLALGDDTPRSLAEKLLERPDMLDRLRSLVREPRSAYLFPFNVTGAEREVSERTGVALYGPHPEQVVLGSKSGSRRIARVAGVPVLEGDEDLYSLDEMESAIDKIRMARPECNAVVLKLNNGFSGQGNAILDVAGVRTPLDRSPVVFCASEESWPSFASKIEKDGGIVEELIDEQGTASPSVQMRIFGDGEYEVVSTHDQILGGPSDQVYLGCRFPARAEYRMEIQSYGLGIARELSSHGVVGSFGVDFVVVPRRGAFLTEINLRLGGTTHPFLMARFMTEGTYDMATGELMVDGRPKAYVATDNWKSPELIGQRPERVIAAMVRAGIAYDERARTGVSLHLLGALERFGKLGATCVADSVDDAQDLHDRALDVIAELARA